MSTPFPPIPPPNPQPFKPVDLGKALKNKPRGSQITFEGINNTGLRFKTAKRTLRFSDYLSFVIMSLVIATVSYITYMMQSYRDIVVSIILTSVIWLALLAWIVYELISIRESQTLEITKREFRIFKKNMIRTTETVIPVRTIMEVDMGRITPIIKYYKDGKEKEKIFFEFVAEDDMKWVVSIVKTIVYLAKKQGR